MHRIFESRTGNILVIVYSVLTITVPAYSLFCESAWCASLVVAPVLPWVLILRDLGLSVPFATYPVFVLLNVTTLYLVGAGVEALYKMAKGGTLRSHMHLLKRTGDSKS